MKRLFLLFAWAFCASVVDAQKISVDRIESDGKHQIMTETKDYSIDGAKYSFGMKVFEGEYSKVWCLLISSYYYIPDVAEVLLKLGNGETIYLSCNYVNVGKVTMPGYGFTIGNYTSISPSRDVDYYSSIYDITPEEIDKIEEHGIKKIRISNGTSYRDKEFHGNSLGKYLVKCRKKIRERLDNPLKRKGLFDDF